MLHWLLRAVAVSPVHGSASSPVLTSHQAAAHSSWHRGCRQTEQLHTRTSGGCPLLVLLQELARSQIRSGSHGPVAEHQRPCTEVTLLLLTESSPKLQAGQTAEAKNGEPILDPCPPAGDMETRRNTTNWANLLTNTRMIRDLRRLINSWRNKQNNNNNKGM